MWLFSKTPQPLPKSLFNQMAMVTGMEIMHGVSNTGLTQPLLTV